jgi:hypothetical protein
VVLFVGTAILVVAMMLLTHGSWRRLGEVRLRSLWLLFVAVAIQLLLEFVHFARDRFDDLGLGLLIASYVLVFVFGARNLRYRSMAVIILGVAANVLVIALNDGMPTKPNVKDRGGREVEVPIERTVKHKPEEPGDRLRFLADILTVPPFDNQQFSMGDVIVGIGITGVCYEASRPTRAMRRERRLRRATPRTVPTSARD